MQTIEVFSGGSCGTPKRVLRPRQSWLDSLQIEAQVFGLDAKHRYGVLGSDRHSLWSYAMFRAEQTQSFCKGLSVSPREQLAEIIGSQLNVLYAVTTLLHLLCRYAYRSGVVVDSVQKIIVGGAAWPDSLSELCRHVFPHAEVFCFYGSVELGFVAYAEPSAPWRPFPNVCVRTDEQSQLWVRSPLTICPDDWLASGDRAVWASDDQASVHGFESDRLFYLIGRVDRVINQSGVKIQPEPIEEALKAALSCEELALIGLSDALRGERVVLLLGPELQPRHTELKAALQGLSKLQTTIFSSLLLSVKVLQLKTWPRRPNGKLSLQALQSEASHGHLVHFDSRGVS